MRIERRLRGSPEVAKAARRLIDELADDLGARLTDARLVASELVTNAWRHAHGADEREILFAATLDRGALRVEVCDQGPGLPGEQSPTERVELVNNGDGAGLGLMIVAQLAQEWGVTSDEGQPCVWAKLALT
jgi:anti-sigma regulatory factor (Ser/Thr protein kinase)